MARGGPGLPEVGAHVPPDEIDEIRIVQTFLASHPETATAPALPTRPGAASSSSSPVS